MDCITDIKNYRLKDLFKKDKQIVDDYINILQWVKPVETKRQVFYMKLKHVDFMKQHVSASDDESIIKIVGLVQKLNKTEVMNLPITEFFGIWNSVKQQIEQITDAELNSLSSEYPNVKWEAVNGREKLEKFGIYNILDNLADGDILKYKKIMNLSYADVFTKLLLDKTKEDLLRQMDKIKSN